jgi:hypothetical protein
VVDHPYTITPGTTSPLGTASACLAARSLAPRSVATATQQQRVAIVFARMGSLDRSAWEHLTGVGIRPSRWGGQLDEQLSVERVDCQGIMLAVGESSLGVLCRI